MKDQLASAMAMLDHLTDALVRCDQPPAGAVIRLALSPENRIFTALAMFSDVDVAARPPQSYDRLVLFDAWVPLADAPTTLAALLGGHGKLGDQEVAFMYEHGDVERRIGGRGSYSRFSETVYSATCLSPGNRRPYPGADPLLGFGLPSHPSGDSAVNEWVYRQPPRPASQVMHHTEFVIVLPDTRGKIVSVNWKPGSVEVGIEARVPLVDLELQLLGMREGAARRRNLPAAAKQTVAVPETTTRVQLNLLHRSGAVLSHVDLTEANINYDIDSLMLSVQQQAEIDIKGGENDRVEFKPFITPGHEKEAEIVRTIIAFANTTGGCLYLGVNDQLEVQGRKYLCQAAKKDESEAFEVLRSRVRKLTADNIKPVPPIDVVLVEVGGEPVMVVVVPEFGDRHFADQKDNIWIRKGGSTCRPDSHSELPALLARGKS